MGTSLAVQWLRLGASNAGGMGSIPGWGTKIPHAVSWPKKKKKGQMVNAMNLLYILQQFYVYIITT